MAFDKKFLLTTTVIAGLAVLAPSMAVAQSQPPANEQEDDRDQRATRVDEVVVTGSRIRRNEFTSSQPIQVITSEEATLEGLTDTTEILQGSTAANTATQINNFFTGFVTTGGPGVNTISLRGLGANRTLVLVNGRRAGPAGVRGTVGPFDLNTIPSSQIERIEILTDGASSIYGSDAVAGVINIITRTNQDGGNVEVFGNVPLEGGGEQYRVSGSWGANFDRGYITVGADYYKREELLFGDRAAFECPQDYFFYDEDLTIRADVIDPATGDYKCNFTLQSILRTQLAGGAGLNRAGDYVYDPSAVFGGGYTGCDINNWHQVAGGVGACSITAQPTSVRRQAWVEYPLYSERYKSRTAISPVERYTLSAFGGYDLTPNTEIFGELLLNRRESAQISWRQLFPTVSPFHTDNPFGGPFNGAGQGLAGHWGTPVALVDSYSEQTVDYMRGVAGIRGSFGSFDRTWDWELAAQYSRSDGTYGGNFFYKDRVEATAGYAAALGFDKNLQIDRNSAGLPTGARPFGAVNGNCDTYLLETATACPAGGIDWFSPEFIASGVLPGDQMAFLQGYEEGNTIYEHAYVEGVISGELFDLPAGPLGMALGFQLRREEIDDTPGEQQINNNFWGSTVAGRTAGSDTVREVFAEFEVPVIRDVPFFDSLTLNLSGRFSDYDSYGDNSTYKVGLNWAITPEYRLRASHGTSFRAPALYEQYLGDQTSFLGQAQADPCINYQNSTNDTLRRNCAADGVPEGYTAGGSSSILVTTAGGIGFLEAETAEATSVGFIWTPSFSDLNIAIDWYKIEIENQVANFGALNILGGCYTSEDFPNDPLCDLFVRDTNPNSPRANQVLSVDDDYRNISLQSSEGIDLTARYRKEFGFGDLTLNARLTYIVEWTQQTFATSTPTLLDGRIGSPDLVGNFSARFDRGDWTGFWTVNYIGGQDNRLFTTPSGVFNGTYLGEPVFFERTTPEYFTHTASLRKRMDDWTFQVGIQNVFDRSPPWTSSSGGGTRIGNTPLASQYDWDGRSVFVSVARSF